MRRMGFAIAGLLAATVASGETIRCGSYLVDESASVEELLSKCGEPDQRETKFDDVWARNADGGTRVVGQTKTEYLTYDRGTQQAAIRVTIVDGKIRSIERVK